MSQLVFKIALYLFCALAGFSVFALFAHFMIAIDGFSKFGEGEALALFRNALLQGTITAWIIGLLTSLFYFWIRSGWRYFFLSTVIIFPLGFCVIYTLAQ